MSSSCDEVTIRPALLSDYDGVMAIGTMYSGRDYLWDMYHEMVGDPNNYSLVALVGNQIVGFNLTQATDQGKTITKRAGRVHPEFRRRGIYHRMQQELDRHTRDHRPEAEFESVAKSNIDDRVVQEMEEMGYRVVYKKISFQMLYHSSKVQPLLASASTSTQQPDIRELTKVDLNLLFHCDDVSRELFPGRRLMNFHVSYQLINENIPLLLNERCGGFLSFCQFQRLPDSKVFSPMPQLNHHELSINRIEQGEESNPELDNNSIHQVAMVTFYISHKTRSGVVHMVDVYARLNVSRDHLRVHLLRHLDVLEQRYPVQDGVFCLSTNSNIPKEYVTAFFSDVGIVESDSDPRSCHILYERPIKKE